MRLKLILSLLIFTFGLTIPGTCAESPQYYQVGDTLKTAQLTAINGNTVSLSQFSEKILFINFFASW